jgi:hypothetical protein
MNIPQNFEKIDGVKFDINGKGYYIETDHMEKGDVWVYSDNYMGGDISPLCFDIDWQRETYTLIKCLSGQGRSGDVLASNVPLIKLLMKNSNDFINSFLKDIITYLIKNKTI